MSYGNCIYARIVDINATVQRFNVIMKWSRPIAEANETGDGTADEYGAETSGALPRFTDVGIHLTVTICYYISC